MVTSNIIYRVFQVCCGGEVGTIFALHHDGREYLVSAKHVIGDVDRCGFLEILHEGDWKQLDVSVVGHAEGQVDISVCAATRALVNSEMTAEPTSQMYQSQPAYFLGFPYGLYGHLPNLRNGYPMPFVKSAILSMLPTQEHPELYLDGINNQGFSGGPVVWQAPHSPPGSPLFIGGVISGYKKVPEPVTLHGSHLGHTYEANTGLIVAYSIRHAIELIDQRPIGALLS